MTFEVVSDTTTLSKTGLDAVDRRRNETTKTAFWPNPKGWPRTVTSSVLKSMYRQTKAPVGKPPKG